MEWFDILFVSVMVIAMIFAGIISIASKDEVLVPLGISFIAWAIVAVVSLVCHELNIL